ncbi:MAG: DUF2721 domain-containing protein [Myxococcota bacterium]
MISWATPLLVLPGVGLMVMSTSARFARLHDELHHHIHQMGCDDRTVERLLLRGRLFRNALLALYGAVAMLSLAGLAGGMEMPEWVSTALLATGVTLLVVASGTLMRETTLSLEVIEHEVNAVHSPSSDRGA